MDWSGVDYCDVFIICLDSHSDGTHSLQGIHCWDTDAETHFYKSDEETNSSTSWMAWGWVHFQWILIFGWTIPLFLSDYFISSTARIIPFNRLFLCRYWQLTAIVNMHMHKSPTQHTSTAHRYTSETQTKYT